MIRLPTTPTNERRVLKRILDIEDSITSYLELKPEHFSTVERRKIFQRAREFFEEGKQLDFTSVADEFSEDERIRNELDAVNQEIIDTRPKDKLKVLDETRVRRELLKYAKELESKVKNKVSLDWALSRLLRIEGYHEDKTENLKQVGGKYIKSLDNNKKGLMTQFPTMDKVLNGFQSGFVYIIAGRPGMGKTSLMSSIMRQFIDKDYSGLIVSLEMTKIEIYKKILSAITQTQDRYLNFKKNRYLVNEAHEWLSKKSLYLSSGLNTTAKIFSEAHRLKAKGTLDYLMIDYLQLLDDESRSSTSDNSRVSLISRKIKQMAVNLEIPVIVASQLNRRVESREDKRPLLNDLRDSGAIEQDADVVMALYRKSYYDKDDKSNDTKLIMLKNRRGVCIDFNLIFKPNTTEFVEVYHE